jgi:hypothetical protein
MENGIGYAADETAVKVLPAACCKGDEAGPAALRRVYYLTRRVADRNHGLDIDAIVLELSGDASDEEVSLVQRGSGAHCRCLRRRCSPERTSHR